MNDSVYIPFNLPSIGDEEISEVISTLRSGWLTTGPRTTQFETELKNYVQSPYALGVNSCTAGLHLALAALGSWTRRRGHHHSPDVLCHREYDHARRCNTCFGRCR